MPDLFDAAAAREARDVGINITTKRNSTWLKSYLEYVKALPSTWIGTGEDIRAKAGLADPDSANAWGAAMNNAVRLGLLVKTGRYVAMQAKKSHHRQTPEYRKAPGA